MQTAWICRKQIQKMEPEPSARDVKKAIKQLIDKIERRFDEMKGVIKAQMQANARETKIMFDEVEENSKTLLKSSRNMVNQLSELSESSKQMAQTLSSIQSRISTIKQRHHQHEVQLRSAEANQKANSKILIPAIRKHVQFHSELLSEMVKILDAAEQQRDLNQVEQERLIQKNTASSQKLDVSIRQLKEKIELEITVQRLKAGQEQLRMGQEKLENENTNLKAQLQKSNL